MINYQSAHLELFRSFPCNKKKKRDARIANQLELDSLYRHEYDSVFSLYCLQYLPGKRNNKVTMESWPSMEYKILGYYFR